jgi:CHASE2 domain-containing sensor protein
MTRYNYIAELFADQISPEKKQDAFGAAFAGRVILIGSTAESINDMFQTPYSSRLFGSPKQMPGVMSHANITSQILKQVQESGETKLREKKTEKTQESQSRESTPGQS